MRLFSWNVNGIRAVQKKGFLDWLQKEQPDILGIQETKAELSQLDPALLKPEGYDTWWVSASTRKGYSGVALYSRIKPVNVTLGLGIPEYDDEGRTIIAEYEDFVFITAYFPNGGRELLRVPYKMAYKEAFLSRCQQIQQSGKPVIFCGDVNTSHKEIDLANPKTNRKNTGFLPEERAWIDKLVDECGYIDTYRKLNPDTTGAYTWWTAIGNARARNVGWRLDYFFVSPELADRIVDVGIHNDIMGSDHCPVSLTLK